MKRRRCRRSGIFAHSLRRVRRRFRARGRGGLNIMTRLRVRVRAKSSPLERASNYPKSRPVGGDFTALSGTTFGGFRKPDVLAMAE